MKTSPIAQRCRHGWSYMQVVSCLVAAAAGVWLGAHYLGVHVEDLAYTALDESTVLEKLPEQWRPEPPSTLVPDAKQERLEAEQVADELRQDLKGLEEEVAGLETEATEQLGGVAASNGGGVPRQSVDEATLAYWNRLREVSTQVASLTATSERAIDEKNVGRTLGVRVRVFQYGAKAIDALDSQGIDPDALDLGQSLRNLYEHGAELSEKTLATWRGEEDGKQGLGSATGLGTLQQQFDQELRLLRGKGASVHQQLVRRYGAEILPVEL